MSPTITALYGGLLGLLYIALCFQVVSHRRRARVGLGTASDTALERAVRVHGNFAEYAPLFLVLLLAAELSGAPVALLHVFGAVFFLARVGHAVGLARSSGTSFGRFYGTLFTWIVILVLAVTDIWLALG